MAKASTARIALVRGSKVIALTTGRVPRLASRKSKALAATAAVPAATVAGAYRLRVCADALEAVAETKESNNCRLAARAITVAAPVLPAPSGARAGPGARSDSGARAGGHDPRRSRLC